MKVSAPETSDVTESSASSALIPTLLHLMNGYQVTQAIHVLARLGVADVLRDGPLPLESLAKRCDADPEVLRRLLRALEGVGLVRLDAGRYAMTPLGDLLRQDHPQSVWPAAELIGDPLRWETWANLQETVTLGAAAGSAFARVHGQPLFPWLGDHPDVAHRWDAVMTMSSRQSLPAILAACDLSAAHTIVDVGGGQGALLRGILQRYPQAQGTLFDRPAVIEEAREIVGTPEAARCTRIGGDMFASVPPGSDVYLLRRILHDWEDDASRTILGNCRQAMAPHGRLLAIDAIVPDGGDDSPAKWNDLHMLMTCGGKERTHEEFFSLFAESGFVLTKITPAGGIFVIEGVPD